MNTKIDLILETNKEQKLDMLLQYRWEEEYERSCEENSVLKELLEKYKGVEK